MMGKLSSDLSALFESLGGQGDIARKAHRAAQVRSMWAECVEEIFLEHTNSVYIIKEEGRKILIVYVDESIFAAELNARRELIKLRFLQSFGEDIDEFKILISRGLYKKNYPFKDHIDPYRTDKDISVPLDNEELEAIEEAVSSIECQRLQDSVRKAIVADRQWKKGRGEGR